jgi:dynamin GTPase
MSWFFVTQLHHDKTSTQMGISAGTRTVGVISKVDQAAADQRSLAAVQALLSGQGPSVTLDIPWVALIGQSVSIAAAHSGSVSAEDSLETAWRAEMDSLKSILNGASPSKLGRIALVETLAQQIRKRLKQHLPNVLSGLEGRSQVIEQELVRLGEQRVQTSEGTRAIALELCREFEDKFLQHIDTGEVSSFPHILLHLSCWNQDPFLGHDDQGSNWNHN